MVVNQVGRQLLAPLVRLIADRAANPAKHKTKICMLLGAGADISSGGLNFAQLKRQAVEEYLQIPVFDVTTQDDIERRFEQVFSDLRPDDRALLLEHLFRRMQALQPSDAYKLLVLLAEAGGVDAVITTNFDLMLERAQSQLGRDVFQVYAPGVARPYVISPHPRFELPKKPYLKLHGDLESRSVMLLTATELETPFYDESMVQLLGSILSSHDLVVIGYGGNDPALARIIADSTLASDNRIFWCTVRSPHSNSALFAKIGARANFISISFDHLMMELARPVLERPSLAVSTPIYVRCLFDWRLDYCNREYLQAYGERGGRSMVDTYVPRRTIEERLTAFLQPNHPLAIISGPSGCGKTTIGLRLLKRWQSDDSTKIMLIRSRALPDGGDIEQHICEQLGGLGSQVPFSLFTLERWLKDQGMRLILFIDGINEFSPELSTCIQLFRTILRFSYFLPEFESALRIIVTVRQETWNSMLAHLDITQLKKTVWSDGDPAHSLSTIACGLFDEEELQGALNRLKRHGCAIETGRLSASTANQLRDPYLLGILADSGQSGIPLIPTAFVYQQVMESRLRQRGSLIDAATLKDTLATLALLCLESPEERFREIDVTPASLRAEMLRLTKDLHIIVDAGDGFYSFDHDRTFEYFLALGIASRSSPTLETIDDLRDFLKHFKSKTKPIAAARLYFQLAPAKRFPIIAEGLQVLDKGGFDSGSDREAVFSFARDVLFEMVEQREPLAQRYLTDAINAARAGTIGEHHLRTIVQAAANLPIDEAVPLLTKAASGMTRLAETEAGIYVVDKLTKKYLADECPDVDLLKVEPYCIYFSDPSISEWRCLGRLLSFASQIGPDNTHPEEYLQFASALSTAIADLTRTPWSRDDVMVFYDSFLISCDRLLFNATPAGISRFFGNPGRDKFGLILNRLSTGSVLDEGDLLIIEPYTQSLAADIEYHLSHLLVILSSLNDLEGTLQLVERRFNTFSNNTPPEEVDFFEAVLVYIHVLHGLPYDADRFATWEARILREWPAVLLYRPGFERGERRGFSDPFDRVFEDGFGVIYPYGVLLPSTYRRGVRYKEYRRALLADSSTRLPLYSDFLKEFLAGEQIEPALQLMQTISGVIVNWPVEGLNVLQAAIGNPDPRVRRATVRILAEAFNRHPDETMRFLQSSGVAVSDEDLLQIKIRQDARVGRRQISEEEWARIGHLLLMHPQGRSVYIACLRALLRADSLQLAIFEILQELKLLETGR